MSTVLCIAFRFIHPLPLFHGRADAGEAEWPPSPMRAFQALLNAACSRARGKPLAPEVRAALQVLELLRPEVVAPRATINSVGYRAYVPHNQSDLVTAAWHRGNTNASVAEFRTEKDIRPMRIESVGDGLPTVSYLYPLHATTADPQALLAAIRPSVRSIHCLGWGVDQVVADAVLIDQNQASLVFGERWEPVMLGGRTLRVPRSGSLDALTSRHNEFLNRLVDGNWTPVPSLTATEKVRYRRNTDPAPRPYAVFRLLDENGDAYRYPHAILIHIAAMVRHVAIQRMMAHPPLALIMGSSPAHWISRVVRGKRDESSSDNHRQFSYVPLPSIGHAHADALIRNVMVIAPPGMEREVAYLGQLLDGEALQPEGAASELDGASIATQSGRPSPVARSAGLQRFDPPHGKFIDACYLGTSTVWHSVTPVILPGHNDKKAAKSVRLIQVALRQAGIETPCEFTWQSNPFFKNCLSAHKYDRDGRHTGYHRPAHLKDLTAVHVSLTFEHPVPGPIVLGAGRHCGFGLMAINL